MGKNNVERGVRNEPRWPSVELDCSSGPSVDEEMPTALKDLKAHPWPFRCWENWAGQCEGKSGAEM